MAAAVTPREGFAPRDRNRRLGGGAKYDEAVGGMSCFRRGVGEALEAVPATCRHSPRPLAEGLMGGGIERRESGRLHLMKLIDDDKGEN